jgi:hypothetical protein
MHSGIRNHIALPLDIPSHRLTEFYLLLPEQTENLIFLLPENTGEVLRIIGIEAWHTSVSPLNISWQTP